MGFFNKVKGVEMSPSRGVNESKSPIIEVNESTSHKVHELKSKKVQELKGHKDWVTIRLGDWRLVTGRLLKVVKEQSASSFSGWIKKTIGKPIFS